MPTDGMGGDDGGRSAAEKKRMAGIRNRMAGIRNRRGTVEEIEATGADAKVGRARKQSVEEIESIGLSDLNATPSTGSSADHDGEKDLAKLALMAYYKSHASTKQKTPAEKAALAASVAKATIRNREVTKKRQEEEVILMVTAMLLQGISD